MPRPPSREPNGRSCWIGAELDADADHVWFRIEDEAIGRMPENTLAARGDRLLDDPIVWITPDRPIERLRWPRRALSGRSSPARRVRPANTPPAPPGCRRIAGLTPCLSRRHRPHVTQPRAEFPVASMASRVPCRTPMRPPLVTCTLNRVRSRWTTLSSPRAQLAVQLAAERDQSRAEPHTGCAQGVGRLEVVVALHASPTPHASTPAPPPRRVAPSGAPP